MDIYKDIELLDCPRCQGPAIMEEENGWCVYVTCGDCGCHTAEVEFKSEDQKAEAAKQAARLWNNGKVVSHDPGE